MHLEKLETISNKFKKPCSINFRTTELTKQRLLNICSYYDNNITISSLLDYIIEDFLIVMEKEIDNRNKDKK